jgi:hypothetical protein
MNNMKYVPKKKNIIDHRSEEGGYYIANCTVCGNEYYPKTSKAMYCSSNCQQTAFNKRVKDAEEKAEQVKAEQEKISLEQKNEEPISEARKKIQERMKKKLSK